jgi:hypothetical protein
LPRSERKVKHTLYALRPTLRALRSTLYALCSMFYVLRSTLSALHPTLYALRSMLYALCSMFYALRSALYALLRSALYALRSTLYALNPETALFPSPSVHPTTFPGITKTSHSSQIHLSSLLMICAVAEAACPLLQCRYLGSHPKDVRGNWVQGGSGTGALPVFQILLQIVMQPTDSLNISP